MRSGPDQRLLCRFASKILRNEVPRVLRRGASLKQLESLGLVVVMQIPTPQNMLDASLHTVVYLTAFGWESLRDQKLKTLAAIQRPVAVYFEPEAGDEPDWSDREGLVVRPWDSATSARPSNADHE